jgi:hypothetical protein
MDLELREKVGGKKGFAAIPYTGPWVLTLIKANLP